MDTHQNLTLITLQAMEFYAYHGCYPLERTVGNYFSVDLSVRADLSAAALSDSIEDTVSYLTLYELVREQMEIPSHILENVAHRILEAIYAAFPEIAHARVRVAKLAPPLGGKIEEVSVTLEK